MDERNTFTAENALCIYSKQPTVSWTDTRAAKESVHLKPLPKRPVFDRLSVDEKENQASNLTFAISPLKCNAL